MPLRPFRRPFAWGGSRREVFLPLPAAFSRLPFCRWQGAWSHASQGRRGSRTSGRNFSPDGKTAGQLSRNTCMQPANARCVIKTLANILKGIY